MLKTRETVTFDPSNPQHRLHYSEFIRTGSWRDCPVRYQVRDMGQQQALMQRQLLEWYARSEFRWEKPAG